MAACKKEVYFVEDDSSDTQSEKNFIFGLVNLIYCTLKKDQRILISIDFIKEPLTKKMSKLRTSSVAKSY